MELSRPDSFGPGGTVWRQSGIEQEANAAHHGSPMRWSWTYGSGGWVEQRRLGSTVDDRADTSALRTLHCCRNRVGSKRMRAPRWAVHYGSTSDARREYDGGGRNKLVKVWWCDPPSTVLGQGGDRDSAWPYQTPSRLRCWKAPQCHASRVVA